jgi:ectoine hydroxylase
MKLTQQQLDAFDRDGYLFFPGLFKPDEVKTLIDEVPAIYARREAFNVREKGSDACVPTLPRTSTASRSRVWRVTRA